MSEEFQTPKNYEEYRALPAAEQIKFMSDNPAEHGELLELMTNNFNHMLIDGHHVIQTDDGEFVEHVLMDEEYFVQNWLAQFAIARVGERNYFDMETWNAITDGFTKGVIILDADKNPQFVIAKFTDMHMSPTDRFVMAHAAAKAGNGKFIPDLGERGKLTQEFSQDIAQILTANEAPTIPEMIPEWFYQKHKVDRVTMAQVTFIRDNYQYAGQWLDPDGDILKKVEKVLGSWNQNRIASEEDKKFVIDLTGGVFNFDYTGNKVEAQIAEQEQPVVEEQEPPKAFDMFS